jgi:hypothetical protein
MGITGGSPPMNPPGGGIGAPAPGFLPPSSSAAPAP